MPDNVEDDAAGNDTELRAPQIDQNRGQSGLSNSLKCYLLWHYKLLEKKDRLAKLLAGKRHLFGIERRQVRQLKRSPSARTELMLFRTD